MSNRSTGLRTVLLAAVSILATLAIGETAARLWMRPANYGRIIAPRGRSRLDCYPSNPRGYFDIDLRRPESRARYHMMAPLRYDSLAARAPWAVESRFNSLGFREVEPSPPPAGVKRVVVFGDSFTEGQGVRADDVMARLLQRSLDARAPRSFEVRNGGRRAHDFPELRDVWRTALRYEPNVLVYAMVLNDVERSPEFAARHSHIHDWIMLREQEEWEAVAGQPPLGSQLVGFVRHRVDTWRVARETTRWYREMYGEANRSGWAATQEYIREMNRTQLERGGVFVLALWPLLVDLDDYPFDGVHREIERFCLQAGIRFLELRPALAAYPSESLWVHAVDHHPNELANRLAAKALSPLVLESDGPGR